MSATALHPTARVRPVALELLERQRGAHYVVALVIGALAVWLRVESVTIPYEYVVVGLVLAGLVLPAVQGIAAGQHPAWDAAMPMDRARYALARLACGAMWAVFLLAVAVGLHFVLFREAGSGWYPLVAFSWGLTCYLLASAVLLRLGDVGMTALVLCMPLLLASGVNPAEIGRTGVPEALAWTVLPLGLACAAAYAAARFPARAPEPPALRANAPPHDLAPALRSGPPGPGGWGADIPSRDLAPGLPHRHAPRAVRRGGTARPTAALTVFRQHFAFLRRWVSLPALMVLVFGVAAAATSGRGEASRHFVESTGLRIWCALIALFWMVLVWVAESGPLRRWNDTRPVDTAKRRVLHAAAGAAWLLLLFAVVVAVLLGGAAAARTLALPAYAPAWLWLGLTARTLALYLAATFVLSGIRVASLVERVLLRLLFRVPVPLLLESLLFGLLSTLRTFLLPALVIRTVAIQLLGEVDPDGRSFAAAALWLVLYAAAAAGAVALSDWVDRHERFPTTGEVRRWLRTFARAAAAGRPA